MLTMLFLLHARVMAGCWSTLHQGSGCQEEKASYQLLTPRASNEHPHYIDPPSRLTSALLLRCTTSCLLLASYESQVAYQRCSWLGWYLSFPPSSSCDLSYHLALFLLNASRRPQDTKRERSACDKQYPPASDSPAPALPLHLVVSSRNTQRFVKQHTLEPCSGAAASNGSSHPSTMNSSILAASLASPIPSAVPLDLHI